MGLVRAITLCFSVCLLGIVGLFSSRSAQSLSWISFVGPQPYQGYNAYHLFLMDTTTGYTRQIAENASINQWWFGGYNGNVSPQWSPDGKTLAFRESYGDDAGAICFFKVVSLQRTCTHVDQASLGEYGFTWSADGQWLFTTSYQFNGINSPIYRISALTLAVTPLATDEAVNALPQSIPNDDSILFVRDYGNIYRIHTSGAELELIMSSNEAYVSDMDLSPDGKWVVTIWNETKIHVMSVDGSNDRVIDSQLNKFLPWVAWSPSNQMLLFNYDTFKLYLINPVNLEKRELPITLPIGYSDVDAAWSPDGDSFILTAYSADDEYFHLYQINIDELSYQSLRQSEYYMASPAWSPVIDLHWHRNRLIGVASGLLVGMFLYSRRKK